VVMRAVAICCALLAACAAPRQAMRPPDFGAGPTYDPAEEWAADREVPPPLPKAPPRPRWRPIQEDRWVEPARDFELAALSADQRTRIARVQPIVHVAARAHDVPPHLVNGIIWVESKFQRKARSKSGANGLMQLMPRTGREVARQLGLSYAPYDAEFNIHAGTYYFARMVERFQGDVRLALVAYNTGPGVVEGCLRSNRPLPQQSESYAEHVFTAARAFRAIELQ
jgi:soluble lytic murein transglycosylase-like protein